MKSSTADLYTVMVLSYLLCPCHICCQYLYNVVIVCRCGQLLYWPEGDNVYINFAVVDQNMKRGRVWISLTGLTPTHFYIVITCRFLLNQNVLEHFLY